MATEGSGNLRMNAQEQIPSWLESLKARERPAPPAGGQPGFSMADLVEEDALPGWMRPDSAELVGNSDSNKHPAMRPAWVSGPNTDSGSAGVITPGSLSASSLIDSSTLPAWMRQAQAGQPEPINASSLVEPDSLPGWLTDQPSPVFQPQQAQQPAPSQPPAQAFQPPAPTFPPAAQTYAMNQANPAIWQGNLNTDRPTSGIAGSSLLDMNALPQWLREDDRSRQQGQYNQQSGSEGVPSAGSTLSAGSLIDMNSLPEWLRTAEPPGGYGPPAASSPFGGSGVYGAPGSQGMPARNENMRVPSRPRAEMAPLEHSEAAANVFSSMLGVASASPSYPTGGENPYAQQAFQSMSSMPPQWQGQNPQVPPTGASPFMQQGDQGPPTFPPAQVYPGTMPTSPAQGYMPGPYGGSPRPGSTTNGPVPMSPDAFQGQPGGGSGGQPPAGEKTAKRGFLETIRGWFHL